jgi:hypothetical protein
VFEAESVGDGWQCCDGSLTHKEILRLVNIEVNEHPLMEAMPRYDGGDDQWGRCQLPLGLAEAVRDIMSGVLGETGDGLEGEVSGPLWLVGLAVRLARQELVVYVDPGDQWEAALRVLAGRAVQAFVVAPVSAMRGADVSIFGSPL